MTRFQAHGATSVELRGRVLVFRSRTHLNREEVRRLEHETTKHLRGLAGKRWAILGLVDEPVLLTPDAEVEAKGALSQMVGAGLAAQAVAFNHKSDPLVEEQVSRIVGQAIPLKFFEKEVDAEEWLNALIAGD